MTEPQPNPYNSKKDWHNFEEKEFVSSNSLFVPNRSGPKTIESPDDESATSDDSNYKKRYDDLKKHYDTRIREFKQELEQLKAQKETEKSSYVPPKTPEELEAFKASNPELYAVIESQVHERVKPAEDDLLEIKKREQKLLMKEAQAEIRRVHPDYETVKNDEDFHEWASEQPEAIQDWIYKNPYDGVLAAKAITLYKREKGLDTVINKNEDTGKDDEDLGVLLPTRNAGVNSSPSQKIWKNSEIQRMSIHEYERYEKEIDEAYRDGRISPD